MDIMMPVMSGETALIELKKNPNFTTPVIALTADAISGARERYIAIGFSDYISKPFTKEQIKLKLDKIFEHEIGQENDRFKDVPAYVIVDNESMD
jgi:CheY-like chemotaxis protein